MNKLLLIYFFFISMLAHCQEDMENKSVTELVNEIANRNELLSEAVGFAGLRTKQYQRFEALKTKATKGQLLELTNHDNPVVRCYSFWGLTDRKEEGLFPILLEHLQDTTKVDRLFGCVGTTVSVADFYIELLTVEYVITEDYYRVTHTNLNPIEDRILDSLVLHGPNKLDYLEIILLNHEPNKNDYLRIRELAESGKYVALPALARYQRSEDLELIESFKDFPLEQNMYPHPFECLFDAIESFPHEYFKDFLIEYSESILSKENYNHYWRDFYAACLKYNDEFTNQIVTQVLEQKRDIPMFQYHLNYITEALGKYPSKENHHLIVQIWQEYKKIEEGSFQFMVEHAPDKAFELVQYYLEDFEEVYQGLYDEEIIPAILDFGLQYNRELTIQLIANNLKTNTITPFEKFVEYAMEIKSDAFIEPLFYRIENEWNGYVFFGAIDAIIAYNRDDLNYRIIPSSRKNDNIVDKYSTREQIEKNITRRLKEK